MGDIAHARGTLGDHAHFLPTNMATGKGYVGEHLDGGGDSSSRHSDELELLENGVYTFKSALLMQASGLVPIMIAPVKAVRFFGLGLYDREVGLVEHHSILMNGY